jgi:DNA-binding NtrC family response regulator
LKKKVLFITSRIADIRVLHHKAFLVWNVSMLEDIRDAPNLISDGQYDLILFDLGLTGVNAMDLLFRITAAPRHPPVFILSREYCFDFLSLACKAGVCGYFHIPYSMCALDRQINRFFEAGEYAFGLSGENGTGDPLTDTILGKSVLMRQLRSDILTYRTRTEPVMVYGETGSGKDLVARMIHRNSPVSTGPFVSFNVSCITASLAESILFGSTRGSFTGAQDTKGLFEESDSGTLFLDEIGELDPCIQPKFLRVIEDKIVSRLGSSLPKQVDFRIVCATNKYLPAAVASGHFREDLFHRLDVLRLEIPPLREHPEDIPLLASFKLKGYRKVLSNNALEKLNLYTWPGNVRQLFNCLARAACLTKTDVIYPDQILF